MIALEEKLRNKFLSVTKLEARYNGYKLYSKMIYCNMYQNCLEGLVFF